MNVYENKRPEYDLFFAMSHGVHRGVLKKGKFDERENLINYLIKKNPHLKFNIFGMNNIQPSNSDSLLPPVDLSLEVYSKPSMEEKTNCPCDANL